MKQRRSSPSPFEVPRGNCIFLRHGTLFFFYHPSLSLHNLSVLLLASRSLTFSHPPFFLLPFPLSSGSSSFTMEIAPPFPSPSSSFTNDHDDDIITPFTITTHAQVSPASVEPSPLLTQHHATLESNTTSTNRSSTDSDDSSNGLTATTTSTSPALPHTTSSNNDLTTIRTPTPALSEKKTNNTIDACSSSELSSSSPKEESSSSIPATATVIPSPPPADTQTVPDSDRPRTISNDTPYATLEHILMQLKQQPDRVVTIASVVGGLIVIRYILPRIGWATLFVGMLGMGFGGFIVAFYLLAVPEATRLKRASTVAKFGRHHNQSFEIVDGVPSWSESHEKVSSVWAFFNCSAAPFVIASTDSQLLIPCPNFFFLSLSVDGLAPDYHALARG